MANFNTHMIVGAAVCGGGAILTLSSGLATPREIVMLFGVGTMGGLLPDIDSDNSVVIQFVFSVLSVLAAFATVFYMGPDYAILELILAALACFFLAYFGGAWLFKSQTVHRGIFHSIPAAFLAGLLTVVFFLTLHRSTADIAWIGGIFMTLGYLTHLTLDEMYSVDLSNKRIKRSFGSALKFVDAKNPLGTMVAYFLVLLLPIFLPSPANLMSVLRQPEIRRSLENKLFPENGRWFSPPSNGEESR